MPTYDYQCRSCGHTTEVIHSMLEPGPTACERCGGELRRVLYPTGIIFKGSGFYKTDSRKADARPSVAGGSKPSVDKPAAATAGDSSSSASSGESAPTSPSTSTTKQETVGS